MMLVESSPSMEPDRDPLDESPGNPNNNTSLRGKDASMFVKC